MSFSNITIQFKSHDNKENCGDKYYREISYSNFSR